MRAEIIAVGTELLLGQIVNTNARFLSQKLAELGISVYFHTVVGDNTERLTQVIAQAASRSDLLLFTGGLGPTQDDVTKESVASFIGKGLVLDEQALERIVAFFRQRGITMTENNRKQALVLEGSTVFPNHHGMAPGMAVEAEGKTYVLLPGPPSELNPMVERYVLPYLADRLPERQVFHSRILRFFGIGESALEERLLDLIEAQTNPTIAPYAGEHEVTLRITARADSVEAAERLIEPVAAEIRGRVGQYLYGEGETPLHEVLIGALLERGETITCAESCTGGSLSALLTSVPGSSRVFPGSFVCYSNEAKTDLLGVPRDVIAAHGAVSRETAIHMASRIRERMGTTYALSVTGVAGPDPAEGKPVGLVYVGVAREGGRTDAHELKLAGRRQAIVQRAAKYAMFYALQRIKER